MQLFFAKKRIHRIVVFGLAKKKREFSSQQQSHFRLVFGQFGRAVGIGVVLKKESIDQLVESHGHSVIAQNLTLQNLGLAPAHALVDVRQVQFDFGLQRRQIKLRKNLQTALQHQKHFIRQVSLANEIHIGGHTVHLEPVEHFAKRFSIERAENPEALDQCNGSVDVEQ